MDPTTESDSNILIKSEEDALAHEVFEIVDYTTASPWEKFTASVENAFRDLKVSDQQLLAHRIQESKVALETTERMDGDLSAGAQIDINYGHSVLQLGLYNAPIDFYDADNDIVSLKPLHSMLAAYFSQHWHERPFLPPSDRLHPLYVWTGCDNLLIMKPVHLVRPYKDLSGGSSDDSGSRKGLGATASRLAHAAARVAISSSSVDLNLLLLLQSSLALALSNTNTVLPTFVLAGNPADHLYAGFMTLEDFEIRWNVTYMPHPTKPMTHILHFIDLFEHLYQEELEQHRLLHEEEKLRRLIEVSIRTSVHIAQSNHIWLKDQAVKQLLPGPRFDPIQTLRLILDFPSRIAKDWLEHANILDLPLDLSELASQIWLACDISRHTYNRLAIPGQRLSRLLERSLCSSFELVVSQNQASDSCIYSANQMLRGFRERGYADGISLIDQSEIHEAIRHIFTDSSRYEAYLNPVDDFHLMNQIKYAKVPKSSLLWRLAVEILLSLYGHPDGELEHLIPSLGSYLRAIWGRFTRVLRWYWENKTLFPLLGQHPDLQFENYNTIDFRNCLLHQKLEMLHRCIRKESDHVQKNLQSDDALWSVGKDSVPISSTADVSKGGNALVKLFDKITSDDNLHLLDPVKDAAPWKDPEDDWGWQEETGGERLDEAKKIVDDDWEWREEGEDSIGKSDDESDVFYDTVEDIQDLSPETSDKISSQPVDIAKKKSHYRTRTRTQSGAPSHILESSLGSSYEPVIRPTDDWNKKLPLCSISTSNDSKSLSKELEDPQAFKGRSHIFEGMKLLKTGEPLWVPQTQAPGLMTEDMFQEVQYQFEKLGTSSEAAQIRAQMQNMEAFKAANPGCVLGDFIRWHSPRDWIVEEGHDPSQGHFSKRMMEPDSLWQVLWSKTRRIPISSQKLLFDYKQEGEKALHWLENAKPFEILQTMLPVLFGIVIDQLFRGDQDSGISYCVKNIVFIQEKLAEFSHFFAHVDWHIETKSAHEKLEDLVERFRILESIVSVSTSLYAKFSNANASDETCSLLVDLILRHLFCEDKTENVFLRLEKSNSNFLLNQLGRPRAESSLNVQVVQKEVVLQLRTPCTGFHRTDMFLNQRLYVSVKQQENSVRIVEAHMKDTFAY